MAAIWVAIILICTNAKWVTVILFKMSANNNQ